MNEDSRYFINSRGILKSCTIHSNSFISSINHIYNYDIDWKNINPLSSALEIISIYVCNSALPDFIKNKFPLIRNQKFILYSGDSDCTIPDDLLRNGVSKSELISFLESDNLIHWYCQNGNPLELRSWQEISERSSIISKFSQLPIGLDYHTMSTQASSWGPKVSPEEQERQLLHLRYTSKPFCERYNDNSIPLCYSNFHFFTTTRHGYDRIDAINSIHKDLVFYEPRKTTRLESWKTQTSFPFVISPHGNGLDCHRTWEALCLGCIPIVKTSILDPLFKDLPVLILNDWNQLSDLKTAKELLISTINEFKERTFNYEKLTLNFWIKNKIKWDIIPPEIKNDEFYYTMMKMIENEDIKTILEIGASSGDGSTEALILGKNKSKNKNDIQIFSIEVCTERFNILKKRYENEPNFHPYNMSSVKIDEFADKNDIINFCTSKPHYYNQETVLEWYTKDLQYINVNNIPQDGINFIKSQHNIENFDMVLIDGSEFTGFSELMKVYGAKFILLDDVNSFNNYKSREFLEKDKRYKCIVENNHLRNGYTIFKALF